MWFNNTRNQKIEVFKILNGYENIDRNIFFTVKEERRTRGHGVTLAKKQCRLDIKKLSFSQKTWDGDANIQTEITAMRVTLQTFCFTDFLYNTELLIGCSLQKPHTGRGASIRF